MGKQAELFKGELMEEKLRQYFLEAGYYVARGVKYHFKGNEITDVDLFLYGRFSSLSRERLNVDLKNKKSSKAFERILWAKGLQQLLEFEGCVVATMDRREVVRMYGQQNGVKILDGSFLQKLNYSLTERYSEEEFLEELLRFKSFKTHNNKSWKIIYERSKSMLLNELDFSGFNSNLITAKYFAQRVFDHQKASTALRALYIVLSHGMIILDFLLKDIAFMEQKLRHESLNDGLKFGNLGREGVNRTIEMAVQIAGSDLSPSSIRKSIETNEMDILREYFSKSEVSRNLFKVAIEFERASFARNIIHPDNLNIELKGIVAVMLDYFEIKRQDFFNINLNP
ncbi:MAG: hypothetical protein R8G66_34195 [Cytophagales bacterium]|nr:hypothetical protein [Cytophagales bacterium]